MMWFLIGVTGIVGFGDIIDSALQNLSPWMIIIFTMTMIKFVETFGELMAFRLPYGKTYTKLVMGYILRLGRTYIPWIRRKTESELDKATADMVQTKQDRLKGIPYLRVIPEEGWTPESISSHLDNIMGLGDLKVEDGSVSGICHKLASQEHIEVVTQAMARGAFVNPLNPEVFPGVCKMEAEVVRMCCNLFHGDPKKTCGTMSSGGSDSLFLACKAYMFYSRKEKGIMHPNIVMPVSGHIAIDKAAEVLGIQVRHVPLDLKTGSMLPDLKAYEAAIDGNTCMLYACAPQYPHGVMDPIQGIANIGVKRNIPFHVDSCLGGFLLPFCDIPDLEPYDFRVQGVTSISADTHKFGYAPKGSSVILYSDRKYLHYQYFVSTDWSGGVCVFPTFAGSRVGASITGTWAAMVRLGQSGYRSIAKEILNTVSYLANGVKMIPGLTLLGDPRLCIVSFTSEPHFHPYLIADEMAKKRWGLSRLQHPNCVHFYITPTHLKEGLKEKFVKDLRETVEHLMKSGKGNKMEGLSALYGMAQTIPDQSLSQEIGIRYLDVLYETES